MRLLPRLPNAMRVLHVWFKECCGSTKRGLAFLVVVLELALRSWVRAERSQRRGVFQKRGFNSWEALQEAIELIHADVERAAESFEPGELLGRGLWHLYVTIMESNTMSWLDRGFQRRAMSGVMAIVRGRCGGVLSMPASYVLLQGCSVASDTQRGARCPGFCDVRRCAHDDPGHHTPAPAPYQTPPLPNLSQ